MRQVDLAKLISGSATDPRLALNARTSVSGYCRGRSLPERAMREKIAAAFDVPLKAFGVDPDDGPLGALGGIGERATMIEQDELGLGGPNGPFVFIRLPETPRRAFDRRVKSA